MQCPSNLHRKKNGNQLQVSEIYAERSYIAQRLCVFRIVNFYWGTMFKAWVWMTSLFLDIPDTSFVNHFVCHLYLAFVKYWISKINNAFVEPFFNWLSKVYNSHSEVQTLRAWLDYGLPYFESCCTVQYFSLALLPSNPKL